MKDIVNTDRAPKVIGPYSQAVKANGFIFVSGQIPIDPDTNDLVKGDIAEQTIQVIKNIKNILEAGGSGLEDVVKTTVYLRDLKKFGDMNRAYGEFFTTLFPARATVEVSNLPKGADVEIDAVAIIRGNRKL
ncbi:MAG TPA: RidA family protein [Thermodesulfobacteriota bacterium]|nr:RidA family protein [Thermodesulfobacteriota bacterium]